MSPAEWAFSQQKNVKSKASFGRKNQYLSHRIGKGNVCRQMLTLNTNKE
jgi:hypothetical protein